MAVVALFATATDRFYVQDFAIWPGSTRTVSILLDNEMPYTAFQCDLYLPSGLSVVDGSFALTERKNANHTLSVSAFPDNVYRLMSYSINLKTYSGNSGALVTFEVIASDNIVCPVDVALRNIVFTTAEGVEVIFDDEECMAVLRGDVNGNGTVNMDDLTSLINYLVYANSPINQTGAASCNNADDTTIVNMDDLTSLINFLVFNHW